MASLRLWLLFRSHRAAAELQSSGRDSDRYRVRAAPRLKLAVEVADVCLCGGLRNSGRAADFAVGEAPRNQLEHALLPRGKRSVRRPLLGRLQGWERETVASTASFVSLELLNVLPATPEYLFFHIGVHQR
jgi:hypothetical protein